jgi:transposase
MDYTNPDISPSAAARLTDIERRFLALRSSGSSIRDIARKLNKSSRTICEWNKKYSNNLLELRKNIFCDLQKKIIDSKTERLEFLKKELDRIATHMKNEKLHHDGFSNPYSKALELYIKLSDIISVCEIDLLKVGINFRDNIDPESVSDSEKDVFNVFKNENTEAEKEAGEIVENTKSNSE